MHTLVYGFAFLAIARCHHTSFAKASGEVAQRQPEMALSLIFDMPSSRRNGSEDAAHADASIGPNVIYANDAHFI
jgi:hypothetical protein